MRRLVIGSAIVAALAVAVWLATREPGKVATVAGRGTQTSTPATGPGADREADAPASASGDPAVRTTPPPRADRTSRDRAKRDALRAEIASRRAASPGGSATSSRRSDAAAPVEAAPAAPALDKDYIRSRIQEDLVPIAKECYESALEDQPELAGKLVMKFEIVGEPDVGGIVDAAEVDPSSTLAHADLRECMRESMMSLSFEAPKDGGTVQVTYPFEFAPE